MKKSILIPLAGLALVLAGCVQQPLAQNKNSGQPATNQIQNNEQPPLQDKTVNNYGADLSCANDSDCILAIPEVMAKFQPCSRDQACDPWGYGCNNFDGGDEKVIAINRNWKKCLGQEPQNVACPECLGGISEIDYQPKCVDNLCVKIKK